MLPKSIDKEKIKELVAPVVEEYKKCQADPLYFITRYIKVKIPGGIDDFKDDPKYRELVETILKKHRVIVLGSRQIGKTTTLTALCAWLTNFHAGYNVVHMSRTMDQAKETNSDLQFMFDNMDQRLFVGYHSKARTGTKLRNNSAFYIQASKMEKQSQKQDKGRGLRGPFLWIDEAAFVELDIILKAAIPIVSTQAEIAMSRGLPWGIVLSSTPNGTVGIGKTFYEFWMKAIKDPDNSAYYPFRMHWKDISWCDEEWFRRKCEDANWDWDLINREYNLMFTAGENSLFSNDVIKQFQPIEPIAVSTVPSAGTIKWFRSVDPNEIYIAGVDVATGYATDYSAIEIVDPYTKEQVGEFVAKCSIDSLKVVISTLLGMLPKIIFVVERNSYGDEIVRDILKKSPMNLFRRTVQKNRQTVVEYGIATTGKNKLPILDAIYTAVIEDPSRVKSQVLIDQLCALRKNEGVTTSKKIVSSTNDDAIMAYGFVVYVISRHYQDLVSVMQGLKNNTIDERVDKIRQSPEKALLDPIADIIRLTGSPKIPSEYEDFTVGEYTQFLVHMYGHLFGKKG